MNLSDLGFAGTRRKTLLVIGAGASRGASFVRERSVVLPPLDLDFFQQLSRMGPTASGSRLLRFVRFEFGTEIGLSMEEFLSEADYTNRFHEEFNVDRGPHVKRYQTALDDFMKVLPLLLNRSTNEECLYHRKCASLLHAQDCIISFNYDCIMDRALRDCAMKRWDPDNGSYGFEIHGGGSTWKDHSSGYKVQTPIRMLKMHGSLNWRLRADKIELVENLSEVQSLAGSIIPPTWFKDLQSSPFENIWKAARTEVRTSRIMIVVGYSVPQTDLFSRSLFKVEAGSKEKRERLDLLVLVNPDPAARHRFVSLVKGGLEPTTIVLEFDYLSELYELLFRNTEESKSELLNPKDEVRWVELDYPVTSGLKDELAKQGYRIRWSRIDRLPERLAVGAWEVVSREENGARVTYRMRDIPSDQVLICRPIEQEVDSKSS